MGLLGFAVAGDLGLLGMGVLIWGARVDDALRDLEAQNRVIQTLERQVAGLSESEALAIRYEDKAELVRTALNIDIDWGIILNDLAPLLPRRPASRAPRDPFEPSSTS